MHFLQGLFNYKFHRSSFKVSEPQYFLFIRSSRKVSRRELPRRIYGKSGNSRPTRSTLLYILLARFPLCIQRRFFRSCSSPADSRLLSLITTVAILLGLAGTRWKLVQAGWSVSSTQPAEHSRFSWGPSLTRCLESRVALLAFVSYTGCFVDVDKIQYRRNQHVEMCRVLVQQSGQVCIETRFLF